MYTYFWDTLYFTITHKTRTIPGKLVLYGHPTIVPILQHLCSQKEFLKMSHSKSVTIILNILNIEIFFNLPKLTPKETENLNSLTCLKKLSKCLKMFSLRKLHQFHKWVPCNIYERCDTNTVRVLLERWKECFQYQKMRSLRENKSIYEYDCKHSEQTISKLNITS